MHPEGTSGLQAGGRVPRAEDPLPPPALQPLAWCPTPASDGEQGTGSSAPRRGLTCWLHGSHRHGWAQGTPALLWTQGSGGTAGWRLGEQPSVGLAPTWGEPARL